MKGRGFALRRLSRFAEHLRRSDLIITNRSFVSHVMISESLPAFLMLRRQLRQPYILADRMNADVRLCGKSINLVGTNLFDDAGTVASPRS
jgi:hypothetical protein